MSLWHFWNFRNFWNFANFRDFKCQLWPNDQNFCKFFFVNFDEKDFLYILVEFASDRISPRESTKNGRIGVHGLNWKIFVNSEFRFEICGKNNPMNKIFMSLRLFWNFRVLTAWGIWAFSTVCDSFRKFIFFSRIEKGSKNSKNSF